MEKNKTWALEFFGEKKHVLDKENVDEVNYYELSKVVYLDTDKGPQKKGLNKDFGFHCNRPFYMVSRLPMKRVVQSHGANNIALNRYVKGRNYQQWTFNCIDKTIRSNHWKNYAIEIQSNGGSSNLRTTSTINSRWW